MSKVVIKVENLSKQYRLGQVGTGSLVHDINRVWHRVRGKEDPYLTIGEVNDRSTKGVSEYVWALRNINFEVKQGEVLGIIGRNGAGKSTLLKILSRTTTPTTGSIKIKGRVASLLEVGTGFHPELSGRDNIFLNGAILGMTKQEIKNKFDEIVDFAGVERYIDTPVKRYSSGMYVRLAFGVAAHLEPEILIVDEVLAVGDAEFQKKALGKMKDVSTKEGRTVLFVSHNLPAIRQLCNTGLYLINGTESASGPILNILETYQVDNFRHYDADARNSGHINDRAYFKSWEIVKKGGAVEDDDHSIYSGEEVTLKISMVSMMNTKEGQLGLVLRNADDVIIYSINNRDYGRPYLSIDEGSYDFYFSFRLPIKTGIYELDFALVIKDEIIDQWVAEKKLQVISDFQTVNPSQWIGIVTEKFDFHYSKA
jgi:lipopolysaccharide transport system ATP-binding protein